MCVGSGVVCGGVGAGSGVLGMSPHTDPPG
jgi:hypothetical protein